MIHRLLLVWKLDRALAKRRRNRRAYSDAAKRGFITAMHMAFERDRLVNSTKIAGHGPIRYPL